MRFFLRHRYRILLVIITSLLLIRVGLYYAVPPLRGHPMQAKFGLISVGMSEKEAEAVFGRPASYHSGDKREWWGKDGTITLEVRDRVVTKKQFTAVHRPSGDPPNFPR